MPLKTKISGHSPSVKNYLFLPFGRYPENPVIMQLEPMSGIEPETSALPRRRSTD